jgi:hypothetical protein
MKKLTNDREENQVEFADERTFDLWLNVQKRLRTFLRNAGTTLGGEKFPHVLRERKMSLRADIPLKYFSTNVQLIYGQEGECDNENCRNLYL